MFLGSLNQNEKEAFISLAIRAAESNDQFSDDEKAMISEYCREMDMSGYEQDVPKTIEEIVDCYINSEERHKKIVVLELIGLMYADGYYDAKEQKFVTSFADKIDVSSDMVKKIENIIMQYVDITGKILTIIE